MKTIKLVLVPTVSAAILSLTACDRRPDSARVCVDQYDTRVVDNNCATTHVVGTHAGGSYVYRWYYMRNGSSAPEVGGQAFGGGDAPEAGVSYGSVTERGGFGESGGHGFFGGFGE